ncbi:Cell fate regulator YaaT, PSP1 superfamily (controls sporulation, competence, biofilm development) [Reichenbachiella agariperforans]|uniref:Cell fate regulator YaaT, PSP1 superfamily (Controls sporulation, competence, biofilm development) n=1 Tax=Reichenbachiella agariperforans TaxID=156994 RepID=A0A1M6NLT7_REIAG|nr:regulatory iron-sulfur-containing complex subunit RicT [Reichenbachiella agariperforans]SHJ96660.1 Cell fate regulator YaaT, PSP1 superfamily (controls sporulation, competence, biofilm development) [Reichenbachiella agariperforans]
MSGCSSCGVLTAADGQVKGCQSNGGCSSGGCNKMNVFDWLSNMDQPVTDTFDIAEIRFKNGRKEFLRNVNDLELYPGDAVVVDVPNGHHVGYVSLQGELVRLQMQKKKVKNDDEIRSIYRIATDKDLEKFESVKKRENPTLFRTREIIDQLKLKMKLTDIEYQADNSKATFYYSADERVDFRELIKQLAAEFKIRVEMRQISLRQEASRLGGIGSCGRELCCSTWLSEFKSVSTSAARYQNLSLNPSKLSGQCGRLKCCLNYELETYMEALEHIPKVEKGLVTEKGEARLQKTDIFRKIMWFGYKNDNAWIALSTERVKEIQKQNEEGKIPETLLEDTKGGPSTEFQSLNSDLEQMDKKFKSKNKPNSNKKRRNKNKKNFNPANKQGGENKSADPVKKATPSNDAKPTQNRKKKRRPKKPNNNKNSNQS